MVDFLDKIYDLTQSDRALRAVFTIAPEMKRDPKNADGGKADFFRLQKLCECFYQGMSNYKNNLFLLHNKNDIYVVTEFTFNELKANKKYNLSSIDNLGILCIYILQELSIPLYVKEHSADLIRYIISEFNSDIISSNIRCTQDF